MMKLRREMAFAGILASVMALSMGAAGALAAGPGCGRNFVDSDQDGICDDAQSACRRYVDADEDGICDNRGGSGLCQTGCGRYFADTQEDGICLRYETRQGRGFRGGRGK